MPELVSILIPAYNAEKWIRDTIKSALGQTWPRKEIIIVNDGSSDNTLSIAREYESRSVKVITQQNMGASAARNKALSVAQGDYIQWLDADDLLAEDKIERQITIAEGLADPDVLFASAWGKFYYRPTKAKFEPTPLWQDLDAVDWLVLRLGNPWMMPNCALLVSRRLTSKARPWDERLTLDDDGEYFCRVVSLSRHVKFASKSRCYYRIANPSSLSKSRSRKSLESICLAMDLTIGHVLARENSDRTRKACVSRLNIEASTLEANAPELADRLHQRITELGGKVAPAITSRKYAFIRRIIGERKARLLKKVTWRTHRRISCSCDRSLSKLFDRNPKHDRDPANR